MGWLCVVVGGRLIGAGAAGTGGGAAATVVAPAGAVAGADAPVSVEVTGVVGAAGVYFIVAATVLPPVNTAWNGACVLVGSLTSAMPRFWSSIQLCARVASLNV